MSMVDGVVLVVDASEVCFDILSITNAITHLI